MTDDLSLDVLIAELETAPKGSTELSDAVARAVGWRVESEETHDAWISPEGHRFHIFPDFTQDLGAVSWLIPDGAGFTLHRFLASRGAAWAIIFTDGQRFTCPAHTEALAICAAALKSLTGAKTLVD